MIFFFVVQGAVHTFCCSWIKINRPVGISFPQKFPDGVPQKSITTRKQQGIWKASEASELGMDQVF